MKRNLIKILPAILLVGFLIGTFSCEDPENPKAEITVVDEDGKAIEGAMVIIKSSESDSAETRIYLASGAKKIADTSYTNDEGKVNKEFMYESIYRVEVTKAGNYNTPIRRGIGVLILEFDKKHKETVTITPQTTF